MEDELTPWPDDPPAPDGMHIIKRNDDGSPVFGSFPTTIDEHATFRGEHIAIAFQELRALQEAVDVFRGKLEYIIPGDSRYMAFREQLAGLKAAYRRFHSVIADLTVWCDKGDHLPNYSEINYGSVDTAPWERRENISTNQYLERKERL